MAKRKSKRQSQLEGFAVDLGTILGTAVAKADKWLSQRQAIVQQLTEVRDTASKMLSDLGHQADRFAKRANRPRGTHQKGIIIVGGRPRIGTIPTTIRSAAKGGAAPTKRRKLSAKGRAAISRAQKARWAKIKAAKGK
jgi:hypothetical protein